MMSRDLQYLADALGRGQCLHEKGFHTSSAGLTDIDHGDSKIQYTGAYPDSFCKDVAFLLRNPGSKHLCSIDDEPTCVACDDQPANAGLPADSRETVSDPVGRGHKVVQSTVTSHEIHNTFCHGETDKLKHLHRCCADIPASWSKLASISCDACLRAKATRQHSSAVHAVTAPGEIVSMDLWSTRTPCIIGGETTIFGGIDTSLRVPIWSSSNPKRMCPPRYAP